MNYLSKKQIIPIQIVGDGEMGTVSLKQSEKAGSLGLKNTVTPSLADQIWL